MSTISALLKFSQGVTIGSPGQALFGSVGALATAANDNNTGVFRWKYEFLDVPPGSAYSVGVQQDSGTPTFSWTPDIAGGYLVKLTVFDQTGKIQKVDIRCFGIRRPAAPNFFIPPAGALGSYLNFSGQSRGWNPYYEELFYAVEGFLAGAFGAVAVSNLAALTALSIAGFPNGTRAYVNTLKGVFTLDLSSTLTADGITIVNTASGGNTRWLRDLSFCHPAWAQQAAWYINDSTGNDENAGGSGAPLKTHAELERRWGNSTLYPPITAGMSPFRMVRVYVQTTLAATDPIPPKQINLGPNVHVTYFGTVTAGRTGTFTAVTAKNDATNQPYELTDSAMTTDWTADLQKRVRITSGARLNTCMWVAKDMGAGTDRFSPSEPVLPGIYDTTAAPFEEFLLTTELKVPAVADPYVVETCPLVSWQHCRVSAQNDESCINHQQILFVDLFVRDATEENSIAIDGECSINFVNCRLDPEVSGIFTNWNAWFGNCKFSRGIYAGAAVFHVSAGLTGNIVGALSGYGFNVETGGKVFIDNDHRLQGVGLHVSPGATCVFSALCVFDSASTATNPGGHAVLIGGGLEGYSAGAVCSNRDFGYGAPRLWGSGNVGSGVYLTAGSTFSWSGGVGEEPTIAGANDFSMGGDSTSRAFDEALGSYTNLRNNTWANLAATIAGGGFGGEAHNVSKGTKIVRVP